MLTLCTETSIDYTGAQLRAGWLLETFGAGPDAIACFRGACDVAPEHMIDLEDLEAGERIVARDMLHVIVEHIDGDLARIVLRQRLLVCCVVETLRELGDVGEITRAGDDVYVGPAGARRKLTVSIATTSERGTGLIHLGVNVDPEGAPVPAVGLGELGIDPKRFGDVLAERYAREVEMAERAAGKVRVAP